MDDTPFKKYLCEFCDAVYDDLRSMIDHALLHQPQDGCELRSVDLEELRRGLDPDRCFEREAHPFPTVVYVYACTDCELTFATVRDLHKHRFKDVAIFEFTCEACADETDPFINDW